jgi:predicted transcriptional regulator
MFDFSVTTVQRTPISFFVIISLIISISLSAFANDNATEARKTHLEDIFIWKMSDELKLSAKEEKAFTEALKKLNKEKSELNKKIQMMADDLNENTSEATLKSYKKLIQDYNQCSIKEFESVQKILGNKKLVQYIKVKNELSNKMKSILIGEKVVDKRETASKPLPKPKVIVEKAD